MGPSGSEKTTIGYLASRLYEEPFTVVYGIQSTELPPRSYLPATA